MTTSPRVAQVREQAAVRRSREQRTLRLLALPLLLIVVIPSATGQPPASLHGPGLVVSLALAALVAAFAYGRIRGERLDRDPAASVVPSVVGVVVMAAAGIVLIAQQRTGTGSLVISLVAYIAGSRLPLRPGAAIVAAAVLGDVIALIAAPGAHTGDIVSTTLLALLLFLMARLYRRAQDDRERAELTGAELADAREREVEAAAVAERGRIARELHDVLAHSLSGLSLQLESARLMAERDGAGPELQELLSRSRRLAADGLEDARRAVRALRGDELPGLDDLPRLTDDFRAGGLDVALEVRGARRPVQGETGLALYRAAQEALTNVTRHSGAGSARVTVDFGDDRVRLCVEDPGGGAGALADQGSGYGLSAMRERVELLGGTVDARPQGPGFRVELEVPA